MSFYKYYEKILDTILKLLSLIKFRYTVIMTHIRQCIFFSKSIKFHATPIKLHSIKIDEIRILYFNGQEVECSNYPSHFN